MTPETAESIYYAEYRSGDWPHPERELVQADLRRRCWQRVIDAVRAEYSRELAEQMLVGIERDAG